MSLQARNTYVSWLLYQLCVLNPRVTRRISLDLNKAGMVIEKRAARRPGFFFFPHALPKVVEDAKCLN